MNTAYKMLILTDSTTLTITYMAVSMVINILTTVPLEFLSNPCNVLLVFLKKNAFLSPAEGKSRPGRSNAAAQAAQGKDNRTQC